MAGLSTLPVHEREENWAAGVIKEALLFILEPNHRQQAEIVDDTVDDILTAMMKYLNTLCQSVSGNTIRQWADTSCILLCIPYILPYSGISIGRGFHFSQSKLKGRTLEPELDFIISIYSYFEKGCQNPER